MVQLLAEFAFIKGDRHVTHAQHVPGGGQLVLVAMLAEAGLLRHDENRLSMLECGKDGAHSGMGDDDLRRGKALVEFNRS